MYKQALDHITVRLCDSRTIVGYHGPPPYPIANSGNGRACSRSRRVDGYALALLSNRNTVTLLFPQSTAGIIFTAFLNAPSAGCA